MLLTRAPLCIATAFDLHVLGLPPAFILSQDQTLKLKLIPLLLMSKDLIDRDLLTLLYFK
jgi:hypothetical protein